MEYIISRIERKIIYDEIEATNKGLVYYLDNSIMTKLRRPNVQDNPSVFIIMKLIDELEINNIIITPKLFIEIIGLGRIKGRIIKDCKSDINSLEREFETTIQSHVVTSEAINDLVCKLEIICKDYLIKTAIPRTNIYENTEKKLIEYPFFNEFFLFKKVF